MVEKYSRWWNQEVKDVIQANKVAYKTWLQKTVISSLRAMYGDA